MHRFTEKMPLKGMNQFELPMCRVYERYWVIELEGHWEMYAEDGYSEGARVLIIA